MTTKFICLIDWNKSYHNKLKKCGCLYVELFLEFNLESLDTIDRTGGIFTFYIIFLSIWRWQQNWLYQVGARDSAPPARFLLRKERHTRAMFKACWESQESLLSVNADSCSTSSRVASLLNQSYRKVMKCSWVSLSKDCHICWRSVNFEVTFWCLHFLPKNERKKSTNSNLNLSDL